MKGLHDEGGQQGPETRCSVGRSRTTRMSCSDRLVTHILYGGLGGEGQRVHPQTLGPLLVVMVERLTLQDTRQVYPE
jgi:hypothetical protein